MQSEKARGKPSDGQRASHRKQAAQDWRCSQTTMLREVGIVRRRCDASMPSSVALSRTVRCGGVAEWLKAAVLKTVDARASVGSNPTASAIFFLFKPPDRWRVFHVKHSPYAKRQPYRPQASHRRPPHATPSRAARRAVEPFRSLHGPSREHVAPYPTVRRGILPLVI